MEKIPDGQTAQDRPDIVARVWQLKLGAELKDLDEGVLGRVRARIYVVEFQKRSFPHAHILVILAEEDKPRTRQIIDKMVSVELPDREMNPQLYETVTTCMIHGPCGAAYPNAVCMKDGKCTKGFPKPLSEVTIGNVAGYPVYRRRRRAAGVVLINGKEYDNETINQWVVPYNPYHSQKCNCHINVEVCTAITAVKYLYKYVYKGSDKAAIAVEAVRGEGNQTQIEPNEILRFLNARYISPVEACMRLLDYSVQGKTHAIIQLTIHLENEQMVTFRSSDDPAVVVTRGKHTMLTRFFELCASEAPENQVAKSALYPDIQKVFVLSGDFRQILPVVVRGTPAQMIDACHKSSTLWPKFQQLHLREKMRVMSAQNESTATELAEFSEFLLQVGEERHEINPALGPNCIKIPKNMLIENLVEEVSKDREDEDIRSGAIPRGLTQIVDEMYADINNPEIANDEYFANRTILTTTNAVVQRINEAVTQRLEGVSQEYLSTDSVEEDKEVHFFEQKVLHTVNINGILPHKLTLKKALPS
ncbi:hypothetical protein PC128_g23815 [Phytophthora cactorum]|nr:hypothetical protein PC128_g23815 [Phytophthora cactorum]